MISLERSVQFLNIQVFVGLNVYRPLTMKARDMDLDNRFLKLEQASAPVTC
jgi:hypothetical protein